VEGLEQVMSRKKPELWHPDAFKEAEEQPEREYHVCIMNVCTNLVAAPGEKCAAHKATSLDRMPRNLLSF